MESFGVRAARVGGIPPLKWASRDEPLEREAMTTDEPAAGAVMSVLAMPSPVAVTEQVIAPHPSVAFPLETAKVTVIPPAGASEEESAVTVKGMGTPMGIVPEGALFRVSESPVPAS
jgi:hypothetical protein